MSLKDKILQRKSGIITYGITPPKKQNTDEKIMEITQRHLERIRQLSIDALVLYDIQEERERTDEERPFPFLQTLDPFLYNAAYLQGLDIPRIIYRCVGKYTREQLAEEFGSARNAAMYTVFVGAASRTQPVAVRLSEAYELARAAENVLVGGVTIPERHAAKEDEHTRVVDKVRQGCSFFISQAIYNVSIAKDFLSDYFYYCEAHQLEMVPLLLTLSPCGSRKTLRFMKWLGIHIPKWLENELYHSENILQKSVEFCVSAFEELYSFAREKGIPLGCNIESVSIRKEEIDASVQLAEQIFTFF